VSLERLTGNADGDLLSTFTHPWSDGTTGLTRSPMELLEKLAALVPLPRQQQVRYGGCLAPQSPLRAAILPTRRQQGRLWSIAAITAGNVLQKSLHQVQLAVDPPPLALAQQAAFAGDFASP
jgi:hypothetical protein